MYVKHKTATEAVHDEMITEMAKNIASGFDFEVINLFTPPVYESILMASTFFIPAHSESYVRGRDIFRYYSKFVIAVKTAHIPVDGITIPLGSCDFYDLREYMYQAQGMFPTNEYQLVIGGVPVELNFNEPDCDYPSTS